MPEKSLPLRVLIIEDELLIRWSVAEVLSAAGHTVVEAATGAAALRAISDTAHPFDVVLLDFRLPDSDDLTLLANIRRRSPTSGVILMTAFGTPAVVEGAHALGVRRVLNKPFELSELNSVVCAASAA